MDEKGAHAALAKIAIWLANERRIVIRNVEFEWLVMQTVDGKQTAHLDRVDVHTRSWPVALYEQFGVTA